MRSLSFFRFPLLLRRRLRRSPNPASIAFPSSHRSPPTPSIRPRIGPLRGVLRLSIPLAANPGVPTRESGSSRRYCCSVSGGGGMDVVAKAVDEVSPARRFWVLSRREAVFAAYTPFVICLAAGRLELDTFRSYIAQDAYFLKAFAQAYDMAAECADDDDAKDAINGLKKAALDELEMHGSVIKLLHPRSSGRPCSQPWTPANGVGREAHETKMPETVKGGGRTRRSQWQPEKSMVAFPHSAVREGWRQMPGRPGRGGGRRRRRRRKGITSEGRSGGRGRRRRTQYGLLPNRADAMFKVQEAGDLLSCLDYRLAIFSRVAASTLPASPPRPAARPRVSHCLSPATGPRPANGNDPPSRLSSVEPDDPPPHPPVLVSFPQCWSECIWAVQIVLNQI